MNLTLEPNKCPSTLASGYSNYSPSALRKLFYGKKVSHFLGFLPPEKDEQIQELFLENRKRLSISGVQKKLSMVLDKNKLRLTRQNEQGQYILKPIPDDVLKADQVPANEHLTMQLAEQVYKINTASNALIFFQDYQPAYITKRFDVDKDKSKKAVEDFASLAGKTVETSGNDYKYEGSYELLGQILKKFVPAYPVEIIKLYRLLVFNYLISNGDAHLKNYSLIETQNGDFILSPAYDLINSRIHVNDHDIAFSNGLFADNYETESFKHNGFYAYDDFYELGVRLGIRTDFVKEILNEFLSSKPKVYHLVQQSYLREDIKKMYIDLFENKHQALEYSYSGIR